jgi:hypothetical protein
MHVMMFRPACALVAPWGLVRGQMHLMLLGRPPLHQVRNWYNLVAASAADGVPFCNQQWSLAVSSCFVRHCHSCCEQTCLPVASPTPKVAVARAMGSCPLCVHAQVQGVHFVWHMH